MNTQPLHFFGMPVMTCNKTPSQFTGYVDGYASTYFLDHHGHRIAPGAFQNTLKDWQEKHGRFPPLCWHHQCNDVIGVIYNLEEDDHGLWMKAKLLDTHKGKQAQEEVCKNNQRALSIGFSSYDFEIKDGVQIFHTVNLREISLVERGSNAQSVLYALKDAPSPLLDTRSCQVTHLVKGLIRTMKDDP